MAHQLPHRGKVNAGIEQIASERASQVMGREGRHVRLLAAGIEDVIDALIGQPLLRNLPTLRNPSEEGTSHLLPDTLQK